MIYNALTDFLEAIGTEGRLLGLDVGAHKIGIALSDTTRMIASPHDILLRANISKDTGRLRTLCRELKITGLVIGLPKETDNQEGTSCQLIRQFATKLDAKMDIPFYFQDERYSTQESIQLLKQSGMSRKKQNQLDDKVAASIILQRVLDHSH